MNVQKRRKKVFGRKVVGDGGGRGFGGKGEVLVVVKGMEFNEDAVDLIGEVGGFCVEVLENVNDLLDGGGFFCLMIGFEGELDDKVEGEDE